MTRAGYDRASGTCAGRSQPGAQALMAWALATYDNASNLGIYNCRNARGSTNKSVHADGRADDIAFPLDHGLANPSGHDLAARLVAHADPLGIQLVIYDNAIWTSTSKKWKKHCGHAGATGPHAKCSGPHLDHLHVEITWAAARGPEALTVSEITRLLGPPIAPPEDDMTPAQDAKLNATHMLATQANERVGRIEALLAEQSRLLEAIAEKHGVD